MHSAPVRQKLPLGLLLQALFLLLQLLLLLVLLLLQLLLVVAMMEQMNEVGL